VTATRTRLLVVACLLAGGLLALGYTKFEAFKLWSSTMGEVRSESPDEILVMRTPGGLLEVSRIEAVESVDTKFVHTLMGIAVGETVPRIRVPAVYRYHIELAPEWRVLRSKDVFTVVVPAVQPSLPVAVELKRMEKQASGTWVLLPFTETDALDALEREITGKLARKAVSPAYLQLQREHARKTVTEFVGKWLVTQVQWQSASRPRIRVLFADEPVGPLNH
jgi:hypothetical protein